MPAPATACSFVVPETSVDAATSPVRGSGGAALGLPAADHDAVAGEREADGEAAAFRAGAADECDRVLAHVCIARFTSKPVACGPPVQWIAGGRAASVRGAGCPSKGGGES